MSAIVLAAFTASAFIVALRRVALLHPAQIWSGSWAVTSILFALRLLPYRHLSWLTVGLIGGSVVVFAAATPLGERIAERIHSARGAQEHNGSIELAAWLSLALLSLIFAVYMTQLISRFGLTRVLRINPEVKLYVSSGAGPASSIYINVAVAASAICALAAAKATGRRAKQGWLLGAVYSVATVYFSDSRGFIVVAVIAAFASLTVVKRQWIARRIAPILFTSGIAILLMFIGLGSLLGKTYANSDVSNFDNVFSRNSVVRPLALPYQDLSASIAALDLLVHASPTWGTAHGCATAPIVCGLVRKFGVPAERVPVAGPFTKTPLQWNGYTFLDRFLIDGGPALVLLFVLLTAVLVGYWWARSRAGSVIGIVVYAITVPALAAAYRQNLLELAFVSSVVGIALLLLARVLVSRRLLLRRERADLAT